MDRCRQVVTGVGSKRLLHHATRGYDFRKGQQVWLAHVVLPIYNRVQRIQLA